MNFRAGRDSDPPPDLANTPRHFYSLCLSLFYGTPCRSQGTALVLRAPDSGGRASQGNQEGGKARGKVARLAEWGGERSGRRSKSWKRREGSRRRGRKRAGRTGGQAPRGSRVGRPGGPRASPRPAGVRYRGRPAAEWAPCAQPLASRGEDARALGNVRGPDRLQECTTTRSARPPRRRGARLPGLAEAAPEKWSPPGASRAQSSLPAPPGRAAREGRRWDARARAARALGHVPSWTPPSPAPPPFPPSGFLSLLLSSFFSMNTHRVYLKATVPHFTASAGFLLPRVPLQFNPVFKKGKSKYYNEAESRVCGSGPCLGEEQ